MDKVHELIGRFLVKYAPQLVVQYVRIRYRREIRIAIAVGVLFVVAGGYVVATREPPESAG
jgi:hypothetical protein